MIHSEKMEKDVQSWLNDFRDVVRKEPGLTKLVKMRVNTGDAVPVSQWPYNTTIALSDAVS